MAAKILSVISLFIIGVISTLGYWGIILLMVIESANIPLPSEVIMPFSGFLVAQGHFNLWWTAVAGAFGCVVGSVVSYVLGYFGGRPLIWRLGKYILISHRDFEHAENWFKKHGEATIFFSRLLPVIRTYISFPAGIWKVNFWRFILYTFLGSFPWTLGLAYFGQKMGENWESLRGYFHGFDAVILALIILSIVWWIWRHIKQNAQFKNQGV